MGAGPSLPEPAGYGRTTELAIASLDAYLMYHYDVHLKIECQSGDYYAIAIDGTKRYVYLTRSKKFRRAFLEES